MADKNAHNSSKVNNAAKSNNTSRRSNASKGPLIALIAGIILGVGVLIFTVVLYKSTVDEDDIVINPDSFRISGMYGKTVSFDDVTEITLKDAIPKIESKTNGAGIGNVHRGHYVLEKLGECLLFVYSDKGPYIYVKAEEKYTIINYEDESKTSELYESLLAAWKNRREGK